MKLDRLTFIGSLVTLCSCGDDSRLPTTQVASTHFRYHADTAQLVPAGIREELEANRADVEAYLGIPDSDEVVDYVLMQPSDAKKRCSDEATCAIGKQVFSYRPFDRHSLIEAYLSGIGNPPRAVREGVAEAVTCYEEDHGYEPTYVSWRDLFQAGNEGTPEYIATSMRLARFLLIQFGPARFMDYYRSAVSTNDASAFGQDFEKFWSLSLDDAWAGANTSGSAAIVPLCSCRSEPIEAGPAPIYMTEDDYRPLAVSSVGSISLDYSVGVAPTLLDCNRVEVPVLLGALPLFSFRSGIDLLQLDGRPRYLRVDTSTYSQLTVSAGSPLAGACAAAQSPLIGYDLQQLGIVVPRGGSPSYLRISLPGAAMIARVDAGEGVLNFCGDCGLSDCAPVPLSPSTLPISSAGGIIEIDPSALTAAGLISFLLSIEFP